MSAPVTKLVGALGRELVYLGQALCRRRHMDPRGLRFIRTGYGWRRWAEQH